ncbi:MAG: hypothetical protein R2882_12610 [Gemmatimonadales bacterium]
MDAFLVVLIDRFFGWLFTAGQWTPEERRLVVVAVLFLGAAVQFWAGS